MPRTFTAAVLTAVLTVTAASAEKRSDELLLEGADLLQISSETNLFIMEMVADGSHDVRAILREANAMLEYFSEVCLSEDLSCRRQLMQYNQVMSALSRKVSVQYSQLSELYGELTAFDQRQEEFQLQVDQYFTDAE